MPVDVYYANWLIAGFRQRAIDYARALSDSISVSVNAGARLKDCYGLQRLLLNGFICCAILYYLFSALSPYGKRYTAEAYTSQDVSCPICFMKTPERCMNASLFYKRSLIDATNI